MVTLFDLGSLCETLLQTTMKEIKPTYVLVSPYFLRNSKWIHFVAQHGSLILAIEMLVCMILSNFICEGDLWIGYLLPFTFFTVFYIVNHDLTNERLLLIQIILSYIAAFFIIQLTFVISDNLLYPFYYRKSEIFLYSCSITSLYYTFFLQLTHRQFYASDLSADGISKLNKYDCFHLSFFYLSYGLAVFSIARQVYLLYASFHNDDPEIQSRFYFMSVIFAGFQILYVVFTIFCCLRCIRLFKRVSHSNLINASTTEEVQYDSKGRAWRCAMFPASASQLGIDDSEPSISTVLKQCCILPRTLFDKKPLLTKLKKPLLYI